METLLASPILSTVTTVIVAIVAFKMAFFTIKKVVVNLVLGFVAYYAAVYMFNIPMDVGFWLWALTALFGPIPMIVVAIWHAL